MTNFRNLVAVSATAAFVALGQNVSAQDDLDDLLKDLGTEQAAPAAEKKAEEAVEAVAEKAEEVAEAVEKKAEEAVEAAAEKAEEVVAAVEEKTEEVAAAPAPAAEPAPAPAAEPAPAPAAAPAPVTPAKADEVLSLLGELAAEDEAAEKKEEVAAAPAPAAEPAPAPAAEPAPAPAAAPVAAAEPEAKPVYEGPDAELISQLIATEEVRRQAFDKQAQREINEARICMDTEEYQEAAKHYGIASKLLNDSVENETLRKECEQGIAEGLYRAAMQEDATGRRDRAKKLMEKAVDLRHPKARRQLEAWIAAEDPDAYKTDVSEIKHRRNDADYKEKRVKNMQHLKRARQLLATRELDRALDECELVLVNDPYNQEAIRIRNIIEKKRHTIITQERVAAREGMMADVDKAWRPVYAVDARELDKAEALTIKNQLEGDPERKRDQNIIKRMKDMKLPAISFKPPATIIDAVDFFRGASKDYDNPELPLEQRGFNFALKTPEALRTATQAGAGDDNEGFGDSDDAEASGAPAGIPVIPMIQASDITFYDALKLVCESVDYKFEVRDAVVMVMHKDMSTAEMVTRSYPVLSSFMERMSTASSDMKEMKTQGFGSSSTKSNDDGEENQERDWKEFFTLLGVKWPEGSSIMYIKTIGKLRVKNTYENLAELEKALTEMNADPKLIEIEARFVEVCQEDLNSLGFEWILNSDYSLGIGKHIARALDIRDGVWGAASGSSSTSSDSSSSSGSSAMSTGGVINNGGTTTTTTSSSTSSSTSSRTVYANSNGASWIKGVGGKRRGNLGVNGFGGEGNDYSTGNRYLSTLSNHISGEGYSTNDRFMRVNAFLGGADLSMILHMLSQRSDTDLLSAPKVLTRPGEEAVMKVVTEYIYPTDYDVQLQSSNSGGGGYGSGGGSSAILAVVEPQSFTMREVGVILDVTPTLTDDGNLIDLKLQTQVVDEPTWKNYGMRIPFTGNSSLQSFAGIGDILSGLAEVLTTLGTGLSDTVKAAFAETAVNSASTALDNLTASSSDNITYYDAPMEQPFFHVRSIDSNVSVYPGATIVMGGLITEARKAMDDKIPFLGDLPFIGRLFRSHSEQTSKRNLLIFVTTRLVDVRGREVTMQALEQKDEKVKASPNEAED